MRLRLQKLVAGVVELTLEGIHVQLQRGALVDITALVDVHAAFGIDQIVGHGVIDPVCADHGVALAQLGIAADLGTHIGLTSHMVAAHIGGQHVVDTRGQLLQQLATGLELQRGQIGLRALGCGLRPGAGAGQQGRGRQRTHNGTARWIAPGCHGEGWGQQTGRHVNSGRRKIRGRPAGAGRFVESDYP